MSGQIKVIVVDDYPLFRTGIIQTISTDENLTVVGEGSTRTLSNSVLAMLLILHYWTFPCQVVESRPPKSY